MAASEMNPCIMCGINPQRAKGQSYCVECNREYGRRNYQLNKERYKALSRAHREAVKTFINEAKNVPCTDCGMRYPYYVMDFDHLGDKEFDISNMKRRNMSLQLIKIEIAKCEVVCSNCHRVRTHERRF